MWYFDIFSIIGIALELWGFYWILRYFRRSPTKSFIEKWHEKRSLVSAGVSMNVDQQHPANVGSITIMTMTVNPKFHKFWTIRGKWSIYLVVIGLAFQMLQSILTSIFSP